MYRKKVAGKKETRIVIKGKNSRIREGLQQVLAAAWSFILLWLISAASVSFCLDVFDREGSYGLMEGSLVLLWCAYYFIPKLAGWLQSRGTNGISRGVRGLVLQGPKLVGAGCCLWQYLRHKEEILGGLLTLGVAVLEKWNVYYGTQLPYFTDEDFGHTGAAVLFLLLLVFWWELICVLRWRKAVLAALPGLLIFALDLLVGYMPDRATMFLFVLGIAGILPVCQKHGRMNMTARWMYGLVLSAGLVPAFCVGILLEVCVNRHCNLTEEKHEAVKVYQKNLESRIMEGGFWHSFTGEPGRVSNQVPSYEGKTVMTVETSVLPMENLYLRGYVGDTYQNGVWGNTGQRSFADALDTWPEEYRQNAGHMILNMPYLSGMELYGESRITYEITYLDTGNNYAYFPYYVNMDSVSGEKAVALGAESFIYRQKNKTLTVEGQNPEGSLWNISVEAVDLDESIVALHYEDFLDQYLEVPENLRQIQSLADELTEELETEYGTYIGRYGEQEACISRADRAVRLVQEEIFRRADYSLQLSDVPAGEDSIQYFLFGSGKGYCQHYASAGALLLRGVGVPARYVTGYMLSQDSFQENEKGGYTAEVLDSDAHAWVEIYLHGIGWIPVEMTEGIAVQGDGSQFYSENPADYVHFGGGQNQEQDHEENETGAEDTMESGLQSDTQSGGLGQEEPEPEEQEGPEKTGSAAVDGKESNSASDLGGTAGAEAGGTDTRRNEKYLVYSGIGFLLLAGAMAVVIWKRRQSRKEKELWSQRNYRRMVRMLSDRIYRTLRRKGMIRGRALDDKTFRSIVEEKLVMVEREELERYFKVAEQAAFGNGKMTEEDVRFCYEFYRKIKLLK